MLHSQQYTERKNRIKAKNDVRTDIILLAIVFIIVLNVSRIDNTLKWKSIEYPTTIFPFSYLPL